jgi:hypothetical protein
MATRAEEFLLGAAVLLFAALGVGCGPSAAAMAALASLPGAMQQGGKLTLWAPPGVTCPEKFAATEDALALGGMTLDKRPGAQDPLPLTVHNSAIDGSDVLLQLGPPAAPGVDPVPTHFLRIPSGKHTQCIFSDTTAYQAALKEIGRQVAFVPWKPTCSGLEAVGEGAASMLVESDPVLTFEVTGVELGPTSATKFKKGAGGPSLWFVLGEGTLKVRGEQLKKCFIDSTGETESPSFAQLLATPLERCASDGPEGAHVACRTSLGLWDGKASGDVVALRRRRRTLGAVHFYDRHPVAGAPYAKTIVSVEHLPGPNDHSKKVLGMVSDAAKSAVESAAGEAVRLTDPDGRGITHRLELEVTDAEISRLKKRQVAQSSEYKKGEKTVTNPEKEPAIQRVEEARRALSESEQNYTESVADFDEAKQRAMDECQERKDAAAENEKALFGLSCDLGSLAIGLASPSRDGVNAAQQEVSDAQSHNNKTPKTIQEDIMDTWNYEKTVMSRSSSATVRVKLTSTLGADPMVESFSVNHEWEDYEVRADKFHNVTGHTPEAGPIDRPQTLLDPLGKKVKSDVVAQMKASIVHASLEEAMRAFAAAGKAESKPGFEIVDAVAYQVAGDRIKSLLFRGKASATAKTPAVLPSRNAKFSGNDCLLVVANVPLGQDGVGLKVSTASGNHADMRGRPVASIEICGYEVSAAPKIKVTVGKKTQVRWALYLTDGGSADGLAVASPTGASTEDEADADPDESEEAAEGNESTLSGDGESCRKSSDCEPKLDCTNGTCLKKSKRKLKFKPKPDPSRLGGAGESCNSRADCQTGLRCMQRVCKK